MWQPAIGAEVTRAFGESNVQVNPAELAEGIAKSNVKLDYILFDACFMSNIEAIYDLRNAANYIIASPCEIMGRGFPYHRTLPYLFANKGAQSDISILELVSDPWLPLVYSGIYMMLAGAVVMFIVGARRRRV
jgi:hypothetical protein